LYLLYKYNTNIKASSELIVENLTNGSYKFTNGHFAIKIALGAALYYKITFNEMIPDQPYYKINAPFNDINPF
jgi:hypothetical protein